MPHTGTTGDPPPDQLRTRTTHDQIDQIRERMIRRQIRDLRLEAAFVDTRITTLSTERDRVLLQVRVAGANAMVEEQVMQFFGQREARLRERRVQVNDLIAAAEKRLNTHISKSTPRSASTAVENHNTPLTVAKEHP
jgi:hypothetical protein